MDPQQQRVWWPLVLVLVASSGLLVLGLTGLWQGTRAAEGLARDESERAARTHARALQAKLTDPRLVGRVNESKVFKIEQGELFIPEDVRWVPRENAVLLRLAPSSLADVYQRARRLEFVENRPEDSRDILARALSLLPQDQTSDPHRSRLLLASAWNAHRRESFEDRDESLGELGDLEIQDQATRLGLLLLDFESKLVLPEFTEELFRELAPGPGKATLSRLVANGLPEEKAIQLGQLLDRCNEVRTVLLAAREALPTLVGSTTPSVNRLEDRILLYYPESQESGRGVVLSPQEVKALLVEGSPNDEASTVSHQLLPGQLVVSDRPLVDAISISPSLYLVPNRPPRPALWSRPWFLAALFLTVVVFLGLGLFLMSRAIQRERQLVATRADFLLAVTHEIKTPLSSLRLLSEMLVTGRVRQESKRADYLRSIAAESGRLSVLVENVLDLGRLERGEKSYDLKSHSLKDVLLELSDLFSPLASRDDMEIQMQVGIKERTLVLDRASITQAFLNVLENARRYAAPGGRIEVIPAEDGGILSIRFRDFGPGIEVDEREKIFEKFRRGKVAGTGGNPGVGLGLYLARTILRDHGGDLVCMDPPEGKGALFVASLPLSGQTNGKKVRG